jgi:hypothetical protein
MSETPAPDSGPDVAVAITRAELRLRMLEELAVMGMALSKEICVRFIDGPYHPEPRHDPGKAFAAVSRSVRLTLAMEVKVEDRIVALRKGEIPASPGRPSRPKAAGGTSADPETALGPQCPGGSDSDEPEDEADPRERETERLDERDRFRVLGDINVEETRADLSFAPAPVAGRSDEFDGRAPDDRPVMREPSSRAPDPGPHSRTSHDIIPANST